MRRKSSSPTINFQEVEELIIKILSRNPFGLNPKKIRKDLPPSHRLTKDQLAGRLSQLVSEGRIHVWYPPAPKGKTTPAPIYSLELLEALISNKILTLLRDQNLTLSAIKKKFPLPMNRYLLTFLEPLIKNRTVKWHPPLKGKYLSLEDPNPADFLLSEIKRLFEKGTRLGFEKEAILQAVQGYVRPLPHKKGEVIPPEEAEKVIFKAMVSLKPAAAHGALVYIPDLRKALQETFLDKDSFDHAILNLAKLEKVQLQSHSLPGELNEEQRLAMIDNKRGSYFMAIGIRME